MSFHLSVKPIYGWGWTDGASTIDTPSEFTTVADRIEERLVGVIESGEFACQKVTMSKRHTGLFDGQVNVTIQGDDINAIVSGFAEISKDLME